MDSLVMRRDTIIAAGLRSVDPVPPETCSYGFRRLTYGVVTLIPLLAALSLHTQYLACALGQTRGSHGRVRKTDIAEP